MLKSLIRFYPKQGLELLTKNNEESKAAAYMGESSSEYWVRLGHRLHYGDLWGGFLGYN